MVFAGAPELLERFRAGDQKALETVYRAYLDRVTRTARAVLQVCMKGSASGPSIGAELADVVQEVFAKAFSREARRQFDGDRPYGPYLAQIARNVAIDHWRRMRRYLATDVAEIAQAVALDEDGFAQEAESWSDPRTIEIVERYVAALDPIGRRVHDALYVRGLSQREAASALGLGRQVIRTWETKLRDGLRRALAGARERPTPGEVRLEPIAGQKT